MAAKRIKKRKHPLFRILLIGLAVVLFWRGAWGIMDLYIFPGNLTASYVVSLVLGLVILAATQMLKDALT